MPLIAYDGPRIDVVHPTTAEGHLCLADVVKRRFADVGALRQ